MLGPILTCNCMLLQVAGVERTRITRYADSFEALASAKAAVDCRLLSLDRVDFLSLAIDDRQSIKALEQMAIRSAALAACICNGLCIAIETLLMDHICLHASPGHRDRCCCTVHAL